MPKPANDSKKRPTLREEVMELDRELLHLFLRRFNLLQHMCGSRGHLLPAEEKELRESWQSEAVRVSSDSRLYSQLFTLLNDIHFFPKPTSKESSLVSRQGFNLAPPKKALDCNISLPASHFQTCALLTLAAFSGTDLTLAHTLMNDGQYALRRALTDLGAELSSEETSISLHTTSPLRASDLSLHVAGDATVFALLAGQYLVRPSRIRFTAEGSLKLTNLGSIARFLPSVGARLAYVVPRSTTFPIRLECTGDLPKNIAIPADLPASFVEGLALALPFAEHEVTLDLGSHPHRLRILENTLAVLAHFDAQASESRQNCLSVSPSTITLSEPPDLPCDALASSFLLAMPLLAGGEIRANGHWPTSSEERQCLALLEALGLTIKENPAMITVGAKASTSPVPEIDLDQYVYSPYLPLFAALHAGFALEGRATRISEAFATAAEDFLNLLGLSCDQEGLLSNFSKTEPTSVLWNAPDPAWALALALSALARQKEVFKLGNPGVLTSLWPRFWALYNSLPNCKDRDGEKKDETAPPRRRRILTDHQAKIPEERRDPE